MKLLRPTEAWQPAKAGSAWINSIARDQPVEIALRIAADRGNAGIDDAVVVARAGAAVEEGLDQLAGPPRRSPRAVWQGFERPSTTFSDTSRIGRKGWIL